MIVNGQQQTHISIADRAVQYGDGCFTTMAFRDGYIEFLGAHIARLKLGCDKLSISFKQWDELARSLLVSVKSSYNSFGDCVVKVIISRGEGGRGYSPTGVSPAKSIITLHSFPTFYTNWQSHGIELTVSSIKLAKQPLLAGIKHLNRLEQVLIKQDMQRSKFDDAIVCDTEQKVIEVSAGNVFWYKDNQWHTADLSESGVEGVMRNQIMRQITSQGDGCHIVRQGVEQLMEAEEVFVCNSLMNIVPVTRLYEPMTSHSKTYRDARIKKLQNEIKQVIEKQREACL